MPTIYEQIEEAEKKLNLEPQGDDNDQDDDGSIQGGTRDGPIRRQTRSINGERSGERDGEREETGRRRGSSSETSRSEGRASSEDAGASQRYSGESRGNNAETQDDSEGTQTDASTSQKDGEDGAVRGQRGSDLLDEPTTPLTNADWARQRRELRELKAKLAQLEASKSSETKPAEKSSEIVKSPEKTVEPDKNVNYQAWLEWKLMQNDNTIQEQKVLLEDYKTWKAEQTRQTETQQVINNAVGEFQTIEASYQKTNPDYLDAMEFARNKYAEALSITNPQMTKKQIDAKIDYDILTFASQKSQLGLNPAEELYDLAMERFGYQKTASKLEIDEEQPIQRRQAEKPNLRTVSNNRRRSASPLTGGGQGGSIPLTKEIAANMNMAEFSQLTPDELATLEAM